MTGSKRCAPGHLDRLPGHRVRRVYLGVVFGGSIVKWFLSNPSEEVLGYASTYLRTVSVFSSPLSLLYLHRNTLQESAARWCR